MLRWYSTLEAFQILMLRVEPFVVEANVKSHLAKIVAFS